VKKYFHTFVSLCVGVGVDSAENIDEKGDVDVEVEEEGEREEKLKGEKFVVVAVGVTASYVGPHPLQSFERICRYAWRVCSE